MVSPLTLTKIFSWLELVFIFLFPIALVTSITFTGILIYLGAFVFLIQLILRQKSGVRGFNLSNVDVAFFIYIFAFTLTRFVNSGQFEGLNAFLRYCQDYFIFLWAFFFVSESGRSKKIIKYSFLIASLISIGYGLLQFFHLDFFQRQDDITRLSGFHKNPYSYGGQLIIFFFFLLSFYKKPIEKKTILVILFLCQFCIVNTSERAVIFGVLVGTVIYFLIGKLKKENLVLFFALLLFPVTFVCVINKKLFSRIKNVVLPKKNVKPNIRFRLWAIALSIWKRNIIFGTSEFPTVYYQASQAYPMHALTHAHNVYLQVLVTNGLIGLFAFLNLFISVLRTLFKYSKSSKEAVCLISIICSFFIEGFFEYFWGDSEVRYLLIFFVGYVLGTLLDYDQKECKINH